MVPASARPRRAMCSKARAGRPGAILFCNWAWEAPPFRCRTGAPHGTTLPPQPPPCGARCSSACRLTQVVTPAPTAVSGDQLNSVVFANNIFGQAFGATTLAVTYYRYSGSTMIEADTLFNRAKVFDSYRGPLQFPGPGPAIIDMRRVFLHELGHALGLNHPDTGGQHVAAVMNSIMSNQEVLSADDIAGGQFLYGVPSGTPPPTPTPAPSATPSAACHLMNISTRLKIGVSENVLIGGFIIRGTQSKKLILRAIGPSLTAWGVPGAMADPVLELHDSSGGVVAVNNDWQTGAADGRNPDQRYGSHQFSRIGAYRHTLAGELHGCRERSWWRAGDRFGGGLRVRWQRHAVH